MSVGHWPSAGREALPEVPHRQVYAPVWPLSRDDKGKLYGIFSLRQGVGSFTCMENGMITSQCALHQQTHLGVILTPRPALTCVAREPRYPHHDHKSAHETHNHSADHPPPPARAFAARLLSRHQQHRQRRPLCVLAHSHVREAPARLVALLALQVHRAVRAADATACRHQHAALEIR